MNNGILALIHQQLDTLPPNTTLLLIHPTCYQHKRHIAQALLTRGTVAYLHLTPYTVRLETLLPILSAALQEQVGLKLNLSSPDKAASQLSKALNGLGQFTLLLDAYDYVDDPKVDGFIHALAKALAPDHRIAVASRQVPLRLIDEAAAHITMLPVRPDHMLVDYVARPNGKNILEVHALGPSQAFIDGRPLTEWDGVLPKCLFYFLVDRAMSTRDDIFETFWDNLEKREATNVFHVTKRKVSEILGQDLTTYGNGFYRLADNVQLHYDVVEFLGAVQRAEIADSDEEAIQLYQQGIHLYRGNFLSTLDQEWVVERREELQSVYAEALMGLARLYEKRKLSLEALGLIQRAAATMPQREDVARDLMTRYRARREHTHALRVYKRLEDVLRTSLNVTPSPETVKLAQAIEKEKK